MVKVLFVCLGNICRSPTAEGVFRDLVRREGLEGRIAVDSAGTAAYHVGEAPDPRAQQAARKRGIDIGGLRGRQAKAVDFERFDYVLAMDRSNHRDLLRICPTGQERKLSLFLDFAPGQGARDVPDPYYEGGFDGVYDMIEEAAKGLLADIRAKHL
ncbi:MAG: low molecular weight phosphotyrosine protein phosphatase [Alphaproteobacteria bacterium]|nr:low molecular weight phosphotyrosine protein phosphatase [Alphaproteobacteria bacterium]MBF0250189.1 low molecular weight phosphotyrosine protein phosphatase [Alphaproteobacteria bacterium]